MRKIGQFVALVALATVIASCMGADDGNDAETLSAGTGLLPLCHSMGGSLRGRGASIWKLHDAEGMLAVDLDGSLVCVDTVDETLDLGLIAIPPLTEPLSCMGACDGTPIPAAKFNAIARDHTLRGRSIYF
jgi:hypothetical protein